MGVASGPRFCGFSWQKIFILNAMNTENFRKKKNDGNLRVPERSEPWAGKKGVPTVGTVFFLKHLFLRLYML